MIKNILDDVDNELSKTINALIGEFDGIRVGRVSAMQVENILIEYYGALTQLKSLATITVSSARSLQISPYDKSQIKTIEKVLMDDPEIDGNVSSDGNIIFINFPEITTEKRNMFAKIAKTKAENAKVSARNVRHNSYHRLKEFEKEFSKYDIKRAEKEIDSMLLNAVNKIDALLKDKEKQILNV